VAISRIETRCSYCGYAFAGDKVVQLTLGENQARHCYIGQKGDKQ
jgi:hypothetical protein